MLIGVADDVASLLDLSATPILIHEKTTHFP